MGENSKLNQEMKRTKQSIKQAYTDACLTTETMQITNSMQNTVQYQSND